MWANPIAYQTSNEQLYRIIINAIQLHVTVILEPLDAQDTNLHSD